MKKLLFLTMITLIISTDHIYAGGYTMDKNHSRLSFTATHFGISHVEGNFKVFDATLNAGKEDFSDAVIQMTANVRSIDTDVEMRDNDLRGDSWFDVEKYPLLTFKSTAFKKVTDHNYKLEGTITIHGITKPIVFDVVYNGKVLNPMSKKYAVGFTVTGKLDRKDFNLGTSAFDEVVGNEIELRSDVEFIMSESFGLK